MKKDHKIDESAGQYAISFRREKDQSSKLPACGQTNRFFGVSSWFLVRENF